MKNIYKYTTLLLLLVSSISYAQGSKPEPLGLMLENYEYPYAVEYYKFDIEGESVSMAYMDVKPSGTANGQAVMLLHGKNFFGAYWKNTIKFLSENGYRVIVPDQIGFGKSSKPNLHYSFHRLAYNTNALLQNLGIDKIAVVGHSMGGMVASRFALMYPDKVTKLVLEDPIGLEDYKVKIPYATIEAMYETEKKATEESIRKYHKSYYVEWKEEYNEWVMVMYRLTLNKDYDRLAWVNALTSEIIYTQPIVYEFPNIKSPTLVLIGLSDRTAPGKERAPEEVKPTLGQYQELGKKTAASIPGAKLVELENVGHIPHFEAVERFHTELLSFLN